MNPENTFFSVKRFIGRKMEEVKDESKQVPYAVSRAHMPRLPCGYVLMLVCAQCICTPI